MTTVLPPLLLGLVLGVLAVWLLMRSRLALAETSGRAAGEVERALLGEQLKAAQQALTKAESQHTTLEATRETLRDEQLKLSTRIAQLDTALNQERSQAAEKIELLRGAREELSNQFKSLAGEILEEKSRRFTELNQEKLGELLTPLQTRIGEFKSKVEEVYFNEGKDRSALLEQVRSLTQLNTTLNQETQNLTHALKGDSKAQGNWGEILLDDVLTRAGLLEGQQYTRQGGVRSEDGRLLVIPDVVIHLPNDRHVVVDSKLTLPDYRAFSSTDDEGEQAAALKKHLASLRRHITGLSEKNYQSDYGLRSLDFVAMFVPLEPAFMLAVTHDSELFQFAWDRNVLLVSPSTLLFVVRTVAYLWRQEDLARNALEISKRGGELYDKLVGFVADLGSVGVALSNAQEAYLSAESKLAKERGNVIRRAEVLRDLGVKPKKSLPKKWLELDGNESGTGGQEAEPSDDSASSSEEKLHEG